MKVIKKNNELKLEEAKFKKGDKVVDRYGDEFEVMKVVGHHVYVYGSDIVYSDSKLFKVNK